MDQEAHCSKLWRTWSTRVQDYPHQRLKMFNKHQPRGNNLHIEASTTNSSFHIWPPTYYIWFAQAIQSKRHLLGEVTVIQRKQQPREFLYICLRQHLRDKRLLPGWILQGHRSKGEQTRVVGNTINHLQHYSPIYGWYNISSLLSNDSSYLLPLHHHLPST